MNPRNMSREQWDRLVTAKTKKSQRRLAALGGSPPAVKKSAKKSATRKG